MDWNAIGAITAIATLLLTLILEHKRIKESFTEFFSMDSKKFGNSVFVLVSIMSFVGLAGWVYESFRNVSSFFSAESTRVWGLIGFGGFSIIFTSFLISDLRKRKYGSTILAIYGLTLTVRHCRKITFPFCG